MKIVLIEPKGTSRYPHSGLAYLAGALKDRHQVAVYDLNFIDWSPDELAARVALFKADLVGISVKSAAVKNAIKICECLKKNLPIKVVCGGPHITLCQLDFFKIQGGGVFDFGFIGEAEISFAKFCDQAQGKGFVFDDVPGLIYQTAGEWRANKSEFVKDLDSLARPDYSVFYNFDPARFDYPLITSRGCPYKCVYCSVGEISGRSWRFRKPENILAELTEARKIYDFKSFVVIDDNFSLDKERVKIFCGLLKNSNLNLAWSCPNGLRADRVDKAVAIAMRAAGCRRVSLGIESGDPEVFDRIDKGENLSDIERAVRLLKEAGIRVDGFFIVGLPGDSIQSTKKTLSLIKRLKLDGVKWNFLIPYPGTKLWDWVKVHGTFLRDFTEGRHFSRDLEPVRPVFETSDYPAAQRIKAYKIANLATGSYRYVFKRPKSRFFYYVKIFLFLLYYSPETLYNKFRKIITNLL